MSFTLVYIKYSFLNIGIQSDLFCSAKSKIYLQIFTRGCVCEGDYRTVDINGRTQERWFWKERKNSCQIYIFKFLIKRLLSKFITLFVSVVVLRPLTHKFHPLFYEAALAPPTALMLCICCLALYKTALIDAGLGFTKVGWHLLLVKKMNTLKFYFVISTPLLVVGTMIL